MMKRKLLVPMVALLLSVGMIGVGFAAWVISSQYEDTITGEDLIVAHPVDNNSITLENITITDGEINFGAPADRTVEDTDWLTFTGTAEDLTAKISFEITEWASLKEKNIQVVLSDFKIVGATGFAGMSADGVSNGEYITLPANQTITITPNGDSWTVNGAKLTDAENGVFEVELNFGWGSKMGSPAENPFVHYNALANNSVNRSDAEAFLGEIYKLNGAQYRLTITAKVVG